MRGDGGTGTARGLQRSTARVATARRNSAQRQRAPDFGGGFSSGRDGVVSSCASPAEFSGASQAGNGVPGSSSRQIFFKSASVRQGRFAIGRIWARAPRRASRSAGSPSAATPPSGDNQHGDVKQQAGAKHPHPVLAGQAEHVAIADKPIQHNVKRIPR